MTFAFAFRLFIGVHLRHLRHLRMPFAFAFHPVHPFILFILMNWSEHRPVVHRF